MQFEKNRSIHMWKMLFLKWMTLFKHFFTTLLMDLVFHFDHSHVTIFISLFFIKEIVLHLRESYVYNWNQTNSKHKLMISFVLHKICVFYFCWSSITLRCNKCKTYFPIQCSYNVTLSLFSEFGSFFPTGLLCTSGDAFVYLRSLLYKFSVMSINNDQTFALFHFK